MTAQTVGQAAEEQSRDLKLINWLRAQQDDLAMAAASHLKPATIVRVAQGALRRDPKLMAAAIANPQSLLYCLLDAARLGHEAGTDQYWLIPFGNEVTGIEGYKGVIERMFRAGGVLSVHAEAVRQKDVYRGLGSRQPPVHEYDEFADPDDRGPLRGVYAYAIMDGGSCSQVMRAGAAEVMKHKAMSRGSDRSDSPWQKWPEPMWKKVPLNALEPYVPTSSEWLMTRARAEATAQGRPVITQGWAPPIPAAPAAVAPRQLVASTVEPQDVPPAPDGNPPAAGADPRSAERAGVTPGDEKHKALVGVVQGHFKRLAFTEAEKPLRLETAAVLAGVDPITSLNNLHPDDLSAVADKLSRCRDRDALTALLIAADQDTRGEDGQEGDRAG